MKKNIDTFRRGSLAMLILTILSEGDCYGYEIVQTLNEISDGILDFTLGTVYPVLSKLLANGYISSYEVKSGPKMVRHYYQLTPSGREFFQEMVVDYRSVENAINQVLNYRREIYQDGTD